VVAQILTNSKQPEKYTKKLILRKMDLNYKKHAKTHTYKPKAKPTLYHSFI